MSINYARPEAARHSVSNIVKAPNRVPLSQSARELLYVEMGNSMVPWDGDLVPYMHEPMDCLKSRKYTSTVFAGPARTAKSVSLVDAWVMDTIVNDPCDFLLVQITEDKAAEHSKKRLKRGFDMSPRVKECLSPYSHDNNIHDKRFKAGNYLKIGWPSKTIFASSTWKRVAITDYDRIPLDVGGEGSAYTLASKRTQTFLSSGMTLVEGSPGYWVSDPTYRVSSPHEAPPTPGILSLYNLGDRRLYYWQCPECGGWFEADFFMLRWDLDITDPNKASKEVWLECPLCTHSLYENRSKVRGKSLKSELNDSGIWVPQGCHVDENGKLVGEKLDTRIASFWQKGLSAAFQPWNDIVYKYLAAKLSYEATGKIQDLQTTVNVDQGRPFRKPKDNNTDGEALMARSRSFEAKKVPKGVRFLTAQIDVQGGKGARFEVMVQGWYEELESVIVDRFVIEKSNRVHPEDSDKFVRVKPSAYVEDWERITQKVLLRNYPLEADANRFMPILLTACDSGGEDGVTDTAYNYYRLLQQQGLARRFMLVKGGSMNGKETALVEEIWPDNTNREDRKADAKGDVPVYLLNTDKLKDLVRNVLDRDLPGRRYVNFPSWLPETFYDELFAEERSPDGKWKPVAKHIRNEALDQFVYGWAAVFQLEADKILWDTPPSWALPQAENPDITTHSLSSLPPLLKAAPRRTRRARIRF